jgi:hypothetical protein
MNSAVAPRTELIRSGIAGIRRRGGIVRGGTVLGAGAGARAGATTRARRNHNTCTKHQISNTSSHHKSSIIRAPT